MSEITIMEKGAPISITEKAPGLKKLYIGMGWDVNHVGGGDYDLDLTVALCGADKKLRDSNHLVYYGNLDFKVDGGVVVQHSADNLTGQGDGDDEWTTIQLDKIPAEVQHVFTIVNIYQASSRGQDFGKVENSFIRLVDGETDKEFARHELKQEFAGKSGVMVAEFYRMGAEWKAKVMAEGVNGSIEDILSAQNLK